MSFIDDATTVVVTATAVIGVFSLSRKSAWTIVEEVFCLAILYRTITQLVLVYVVRVRHSRIWVFEIGVRNMRDVGVRSY